MSRYLTALIIALAYKISAQNFTLSGKISGKNEALPFATIIVKGTTFLTNSNSDGYYSLRLPVGSYEIVFQYIGYSSKTEEVNLNENRELNVTLKTDGITLNEIEVKAGEDPAYPIIRKAIKKRKYYLNQVDAYSCKAYIKGFQKINSLPKNIASLLKIAGANASDTADIRGVIYLSESESRYHFRRPEDEKEIMYSSKVSGDNRSFSFNQLSEMKLNFYNNQVELKNVSSHTFTSPLNDNALLFYRFFLLGDITNEGKTIHKIKVVPKRKTDPCFSGIIYIQDSTWRITGVDLMLTKDVKIRFVDTLYIKQLYAPVVGDSIWMPVTLNFGFDFKAFGFKGVGYFNAHIKEYELNPVFPDGFFKNEELIVEEGANKKDSAYWANNRPLPLTPEERLDYVKKDSIVKARSTDRYKDSVDRKNNRFEFSDLFLGYKHYSSKKELAISLPGLITNGVQYNTVEGLNLSYKFALEKEYENFKSYNVRGRLRYGFSNKLWGGEISYNYFYNPMRFSRFGFTVKSIAEQYNRVDPISPLVNSLYSLLLNENYMKTFKETGVEGNYQTELTNGFFFNGYVRYMQRDPLRNTSDILFIDDKTKLFTSNDPRHASIHDSLFTSNRAFTTEFSFTFRYKQKYTTRPNQKIITGSKYPRLTITYKRAFPVLNATADFDLLSGMISDRIRLGMFGRLAYRLRGGGFLNTKQLYFMDFKHFLGNQTIINTNDYLNSFRLLPYYTFSADRWFAEAHGEHHFHGFIINQIPLLNRLKVEEVVGAHFLASNRLPWYYEINFGIERIFNVIRFDYVLGYSPYDSLHLGFTVGLNIGF